MYASLHRRRSVDPTSPEEVAEVLGAVWAHATPLDGLEHASGRAESDRIDLLLYLLSRNPGAPDACGAVHRAVALLMRCHRASPFLWRRYVPPRGVVAAPD